jgi:hypothetical protein
MSEKPWERDWYHDPENWDPERDPGAAPNWRVDERNWRIACDYLLTFLWDPSEPEYYDQDVVQAMRDRPKGEVIRGFSSLSTHLLSQLVIARGEVDEHETVRLPARRILEALRDNPP